MKLNIKSKNSICRIRKKAMLFLLFCLIVSQVHPQYKVRYDNDNVSELTFGPDENNGFRVAVSLVALFTTGASDRNGFRLGGGLTISQTINDWTLSTGFDAYKSTGKFGIGTSFAGFEYDDGRYGASYYVNKYYQGDKQVSGIIAARLNDFDIRFEDDILAYPFTGFKVYDRYRSAALEVRYKSFLAGTNVYTTDINGVTDVSSDNVRGVYREGRQISSPVYVGYTTNNLILRTGINDRTGGLLGQNIWHQHVFNTPDFKYGTHNNWFMQVGVDKPYTLY